MQRGRISRLLLGLSLAIWPLIQLNAGTFGKVLPIRGHISDIALDSRRGVLYAANYTTNRVEVVSLPDMKLGQPIGVDRQPADAPEARGLPDARSAIDT